MWWSVVSGWKIGIETNCSQNQLMWMTMYSRFCLGWGKTKNCLHKYKHKYKHKHKHNTNTNKKSFQEKKRERKKRIEEKK